jgi:hypothetical protein
MRSKTVRTAGPVNRAKPTVLRERALMRSILRAQVGPPVAWCSRASHLGTDRFCAELHEVAAW